MIMRKHVKGKGVVNSIINKLPVELHLPGYQYCGPGTRLARGDPGVNPLDQACRGHDIAYSENSNLEDRHKADYILEQRAWKRVKSKDAKLGEKAAAWAVTNAMKVKRKLGMGVGGCNNKNKIPFRKAILTYLTNLLKEHASHDVKKDITMSLNAARMAIKQAGGRKKINVPHIIPLPKTGGILPLIPIFAGLSAIGSFSGGLATIRKTILDAKNSQKASEKAHRHNRAMEDVALGKKGSGLYMKPYKNGYGLYLKKQQIN